MAVLKCSLMRSARIKVLVFASVVALDLRAAPPFLAKLNAWSHLNNYLLLE